MSHVRVKICGLTREIDVREAVSAGADALGLVFSRASRRTVEVAQAAQLCAFMPAFVTRVALFVDQQAEEIRSILHQVPVHVLQFHGREDAAYCRQFGRPYIKAVSGVELNGVGEAEKAFPDAVGILVDSHLPGAMGGTGKTFDWNGWSAGRMPLILAGGLNPENVGAAIRQVRPWAVDVSSGVESAPGIKDKAAIRRFIEEARREH